MCDCVPTRGKRGEKKERREAKYKLHDSELRYILKEEDVVGGGREWFYLKGCNDLLSNSGQRLKGLTEYVIDI